MRLVMSSPHFHGSSTSALSLHVGNHASRPQYSPLRVRFIKGLAINQIVNRKLSLRVHSSTRYWKKPNADVAVHVDHRSLRSLAPLEMQSSQGKLLMAMINERRPPPMISQVASHLLELLAAASTASSHDTPHFNADVLSRRIAGVKEKERSRALQDIMYALVACRIVDAMAESPVSTQFMPDQHDGRMEEDAMSAMPDHRRDNRLRAIHSLDVQPLVDRHVAMVINGKNHARLPFDPHALARVCRFEMGKMYAASVMHGYFLTRVQQRFELERGLQQLEVGSMRLATMETYMEVGFDAEALRRTSRMGGVHTVEVIEQHVEALFGKAPVHIQETQNRCPLHAMDIQLGSVKSLILQALAFGALLWDVEYNFIPVFFPLCLEED